MDHSHLQALLENYGYIAVFIGALLEGETVLVMAGFAAHRGLLHLQWVIAVAAAGGFIGDQIFFALGRYRGRQMLVRLPSVQRHAARVEGLIHRHSTWLIIGVRFMYGLRIAGPVLIGMSRVSHVKFAMLNLLGALIWAVVVTGVGYLFGEAVGMVIHDARRYELVLLLSIAAVGIVVWAVRKARRGTVRPPSSGAGM
jgi:membrane protein DedA with SNARE-associated domain